MRKGLFFLSLLLLLSKYADAQQDPQFTQYMFNTLYYNPAFAGVEGVTKFTAIHRSQWLGYTPTIGSGGAPTTELISFTAPIFKANSGVGAYIVNDNLGPQSNLEAQLSYAYHLAVKDGKLSLGVRAGVYSQTIHWDLYRPVDPNDPLLKDGAPTSQQRLDLAVGLYYRKEKFYAGLAFNHLTQANFDFDVGQRSALNPHVYFTSGYFYDVNFDLRFQFMTMVKMTGPKVDPSKISFDLGGIAYLKNTMWGGLSFRQAEAAILLLGYSFLKDKSLKLGYALDYVIKDQQAKQPTSHEFMLTYELPVTPIGKKVVRTPRYRH